MPDLRLFDVRAEMPSRAGAVNIDILALAQPEARRLLWVPHDL